MAFEQLGRDPRVLIVDKSAIHTSEICKGHLSLRLANLTVTSSERGIVQHQVTYDTPPDDGDLTVEGKNLSGVGTAKNSKGDHR